MFFISDVFAAGEVAGGAGDEGGGIAGFIPIIVIFVIFYLLLIRPQQKKLKEHRHMVENLKRGDKVITAGGIVGTIEKINPTEDLATVEIASGIKIQVVKSTISELNDKREKEVVKQEIQAAEGKNSGSTKNTAKKKSKKPSK